MAKKVGIKQHTEQRIISGARVAFDPRTTQQANDSRDPENYRALEKPHREYLWKLREAEKRSSKQEAA